MEVNELLQALASHARLFTSLPPNIFELAQGQLQEGMAEGNQGGDSIAVTSHARTAVQAIEAEPCRDALLRHGHVATRSSGGLL